MGFIATITPNPLLGEVSCFINSCLVFVLGSQQSWRRRKHATANIYTSVTDIIIFCFGGLAIQAAAKTRKSQYLDCCTRQLFISLALQPPVGTCQPVCCWVHPHCQSNPSFVMSENLQDLHQQGVPSHLLESPGSIPQSSSTFERTAGVPPGASIFIFFFAPLVPLFEGLTWATTLRNQLLG